MHHHEFIPNQSYKHAILLKSSSFNRGQIVQKYIQPLEKLGIPAQDVIAFDLDYGGSNKPSAKTMRDYLSKLLPSLTGLGIYNLYVADANYFKSLTGQTKAEPHLGYVLKCVVKGFEDIDVIYGINYQSIINNPANQDKLDLSIKTLVDSEKGTYTPIGEGIIHSETYPETYGEVRDALQKLHQYDTLTCDIEGFSLRFEQAGIGTIAFAWDEHNGIAFPVDWQDAQEWLSQAENPCAEIPLGWYGKYDPNYTFRVLLKEFFKNYKGKLIFHNASYDAKVLIYNLWMGDLNNTEGLLDGLDILTRDIEDTKIISFLATNTTAGNHLGLKTLAHEYAGNWAVEEISDICKIPLPKLLQYNLVDALSTFYVYKKNYPVMIRDNQEPIYKELMLPSLKMILQMELTGMPLDPKKVKEVKQILTEKVNKTIDYLNNSPVIKLLNALLTDIEYEEDYQSRVAKAKNPQNIKYKDRSTFETKVFNPNSGPQLQRLLYTQMGLPVLDKTDKDQPATGAETLEKLINHTDEPEYKKIIELLIEYGKTAKILSSFIPAFEAAIQKGEGIVWLHGSFNINGTVSGRLSSSDPNLQNIPSGSFYAKMIKECFVSPPGWLFCGADFNSLEDMISALTTKDPNKLKVYTDGFDGHSIRAVAYFREQLMHIDPTDPKSVNTLKEQDHPLRQFSKTPTFALTYQGTYHTLMKNLGWSMEKAMAVEAEYHKLYKVSDDYIRAKIEEASRVGYVEVAFGLRVRTPLLGQVVYGSKGMPNQAAQEARTAGNACGQSYGLLNNRAAVAFMQKVWASKYRLLIKPVALIHDAIYILVKNDVEVLEWANKTLIAEMRWQDLPEIQHPTVKLGANLMIFYPDWAHPVKLPNEADGDTIEKLCTQHLAKMAEGTIM